jgi:hypothetical protein
MGPDCTHCLNCKINRAKRYLRCSSLYWLSGIGTEKIIKLRPEEANNLDIVKRKIFNSAERCPSMISMD